MKTQLYHIEFLTPCFGAGADQTKAELRPSEIRGQLRWWFRALGGTLQQERKAFGGVHQDQPVSSKLLVRVHQQPQGEKNDWTSRIERQGVGPETYLLGFFCGKTGRLNATGALPPGSKAVIEILFKETPSELLELALEAFFSMGALGFRITRCAGALCSEEYKLNEQGWSKLSEKLTAKGFQVTLIGKPFNNWVDLITHAGTLLKNGLRGRNGLGISAGAGGTRPNALGSAKPRQASVLHLRPVRIDNQLRLALIEAPHGRILGPPALRAHNNRGSIIALARERKIIQR
ncbi:MAG: type III-B CRISPR module RAMP protein Cmr1 [Verrucomicrobiae bacterium]|nr:type III-B CRISPR module RAMP protein Cmr1 [Verrucomicrobiae bacterium]